MTRKEKVDKLKAISTPEGPDAKWRQIARKFNSMTAEEREQEIIEKLNQIKKKR